MYCTGIFVYNCSREVLSMQRILMARGLNELPAADINNQIAQLTGLGSEWKIISTETRTTVFAQIPDPNNEQCPIHQCWYTITLVMEESDPIVS